MLTENFADIFGSVLGSVIEAAAAYKSFCRIISHRPCFREYAVITALSSILSVNAVAFALLMTIMGIFFSKSRIAASAAAAAVAETAFQLSFSFWGSVISGVSSLVNVREQPLFGNCAMLAGEILSVLTAMFILKKAAGLFTQMHNASVSVLFLTLPVIFISGYYINHIILGNTVSYCNLPRTVNTLYAAAAVLSGICGFYALLISAYRFRQLEYANCIQEKYICEARKKLDITKAYRHDCMNHLTVLNGLVKAGQTENAKRYLSDLEANYALSPDFRTGNTAADIIITDKFSLAADKKISAECALNIPSGNFSDADICTLLANALDNAIHGCERACGKKYIRLSGHEQGKIFIINIENSFDGSSGFICGTGIENMRRTAQKYGGSVVLFCEGNVFHTSILLNISQRRNDISQHRY